MFTISPNPSSSKLPPGFRVIHFDTVDSTNNMALEEARAGAEGGLWVIADQQTAARGSRGRSWQSLDGNLFASVLLRNPAEAKSVSDLAFVSVLAVEATISKCFETADIPPPEISVKWPNDVLIEGRKVSGILLENHVLDGENCVIAGFGINIANHPENGLYPSTALEKHALVVGRIELFEELVYQFACLIDLWQQGRNFIAIRQKWLAKAKGLGEPVTVKTGISTKNKNAISHAGIFVGIDERGALILKMEDGSKKRIHVGDVFFND